VMLGQTQVLRVIPKYAEFIKTFSTVEMLAQATPAHVLRIWKGMGYNRRALYLANTAKMIVDVYHGKFPLSEKELRKLPGLGIYTARAILVFAYDQEVPLVDTNIRQIITRFFFGGRPQKPSAIEYVAWQLIPHGKSWEWHQALMDYGALELKKVNVKLKTFKKKSIPFTGSHRFYRGLIVDRLRDGPVREQHIIRACVASYDKSEQFMAGIIDSLVKDGLMERTPGGMLRLPGD